MDDHQERELRAEFAAWFMQHDKDGRHVGRKYDGNYALKSVGELWEAWKAARRSSPSTQRQGEEARDAVTVAHLKAARDAVRRVVADLGVLHEGRPPEMAATIALTALTVSDDLEMAASSLDAAINGGSAHPSDTPEGAPC